MRRVRLSYLTVRGRSFAAAGAATLVAGMLLGYIELIRVGSMLVLLPLLSLGWVMFRPQRLALSRSGVPVQLPVEHPAMIRLQLTNKGGKDTGLALMTEKLPRELGRSPRFAVDAMGAGTRRLIDYRIRASRRGRYSIGPVEARLVDPFGFVEAPRSFTNTQSVIVTPRVVSLPYVPLQGGPSGSGERRARQFLTGSPDDSTVRDYRRGDDLRRVHWRSSAHHNSLMVRSEEQPWHSRATIILDTRAAAFGRSRTEDQFETAVSFAASVAVHLIRREFAVRLVESDGTDLTGGWHLRGSAGAEEHEVLEALAMVETTTARSVSHNLAAGIGAGEIVVAIVGALSEPDDESLRALAARGTTALAFPMTDDAGPSHPWIVTQVHGPDSFAETWSTAARGIRRTRRLTGVRR